MKKHKEPEMLHLPVSAVIVVEDGEARVVSAEYADVTPDFMARFLLDRFGADTIFGYKPKEAANEQRIG